MDNDLDAHFIRRISVIENELLEPIIHRSSLNDFNDRWATLVDDLAAAIDAKSISSSAITIAHSLAIRVAKMVESFLDIEVLAEKLMLSLLDDTSLILESSTTGTRTPPAETHDPSAVPSYIKPSYEWLLDNLQDPYPSSRVRDDIAQKSAAARKDIDSWFIDARKRIGWNSLRKTSFSNKRVDIVDAATRFFVQDDPKRPLDPTIEYELISIKKCAKDLYVEKFSETALATKLDVTVKTLTAQTKAEAKAEQLRQLQLEKDRQLYPSPERSPEPTRLSPVPHDDEDSVTAPQSTSVTSRKRSLSSEPQESCDDSSADRPMKRSRIDTSNLSSEAFPIGLPPPAPSVDGPLQAVLGAASNPAASSVPAAVPAPSRKRRSSDSDGQGLPKRPRNLPVGPRLQAVSDPLPLASALFDVSAFDGWFQQNFDFQDSALNEGEISPSGFDVELGNLPDFEHDSQSGSSNASPLMTPHTFDLPTLEVTSGLTESQPTQLPTEFNFDLATMLSNELTNFSDQVTPTAQDSSVPEIPSLRLDLFTDFSAATGAINPAMTMNSCASSFNYQWDSFNLLDMGPQVHNADPLQSSLGFLLPTSGNFMMPSSGDYFTPSLADVRAEKEAKLRQMREEALRLELELAAS
ncbi:hypothetical protein DXG03_008747 [Asterophora parasitica]|uniref:Homeodomain mating-type protein n=1 Tax=Asterophora parasitica TaxID=117018 RepID=A0A9P7KA23_9AGAR|nr:hypothetical protein DXG03_008747 [Asterophora parasitica]